MKKLAWSIAFSLGSLVCYAIGGWRWLHDGNEQLGLTWCIYAATGLILSKLETKKEEDQ